MKGYFRKFVPLALATVFAALSVIYPARAAPDVSIAELQAVAHALGFLEGVPRSGTIEIGIVYNAGEPDGRALALQTAGRLTSISGPNQTTFKAVIIPTADLLQGTDQLDAVFLNPGTSNEAATITDAVKRRHLVSISDDPACLDTGCCVLMVRINGPVEIVLHTALAEIVGARFSTIFKMMVKRR